MITGIQRQKKTQLKTNNGINKVQTYFTSIYCCSNASVFIKGKTWDNHNHTVRENTRVTTAIIRNVLKRTFWLFKQTLKVLKQKTSPKGMNTWTLPPREQCHSKFQKMIFDTSSLTVPSFLFMSTGWKVTTDQSEGTTELWKFFHCTIHSNSFIWWCIKSSK